MLTMHDLPKTPLEMSAQVFPDFAARPHLSYLSERIAQAVQDVENGVDRRIIIEMPPRSGKTLLATTIASSWMLSCHPTWPIVLTSHDSSLATSWGREIRRWIVDGRLGPHVGIASDAGAAGEWQTTDGGGVLSRSVRESLTGRGAKVLLIDDPHKDFVESHSKVAREMIWNWWLSVAQTRLQPPSLVIVTMTRWHEDDFVGRLLSKDHEGDPAEWEVIRLPAIAEKGDILGRKVGDPLFSPLLSETHEEALKRWGSVKRAVGTYVWSAMYQQRPAPAKGAIFSTDWWRFWTTDPSIADGKKIILTDPGEFAAGSWLDSWDFTFKATDTSDYVVGQRWVKMGANRYLIAQQRARMSFTETIKAMEAWCSNDPMKSPYGQHVHKRLIEDKANGPAIISQLKDKVAGIKPISPRDSKEARARAVTPEIESGNVLLPHPDMPGYSWVRDLVAEFRNFPRDAHDDQVDALTQALLELRSFGEGKISVPGRGGASLPGGYRVSSGLTSRRRV